MKQIMKRALAMALALTMVLSFCITGFAAGKVSVAVTGDGTVAAGEVETFAVEIANNTGIAGYVLNYIVTDENGEDVTSSFTHTGNWLTAGDVLKEDGETMGTFNRKGQNLTWTYDSNVTANGELCTMKLTADTNLLNGTYTIVLAKEGGLAKNFCNEDKVGVDVDFVEYEFTLTGGIDVSDYVPSITAQPEDVTATYTAGVTTADLAVTASAAAGTLTYQWYKNDTKANEGGTAITGATSATYTAALPAVGSTEYYYCVVTETTYNKTAVSDAATVTHNAAAQTGFAINSENTVEFGGELTVTTTGGTGTGAVTFEVTEGSDVAEVNATTGVVTIKTVGTFNVKATKASDGNYNKAEATQTVTVTAKKITAPTADTASYTYTGSEQTYTVAASDAYTVTGNKQTNAGTYTVTVALNDKTNTTWTDGTTADKTFTWVIAKASVTIEAADLTIVKGYSATVSATANGDGELSYKISQAGITLDGTTVKVAESVAEGAYDLVITAAETANYKAATKTVKVNVVSKQICDVTLGTAAQQSPVTYTGSDFNVKNFVGAPTSTGTGEDGTFTYYLDGKEIDINAATVKNVGTYTVTVKYQDSKYVGEATVTIVVKAKEIAVPAADSTTFTYTGSEQTYTVAASDAYTVTGNKQTAAGAYTVKVTLNDTANTVWADGTTAAKEFTFTIKAKEITAPTADSTSFTYTGSEQTYTVAASDAYTVTGNKQTAAGAYTVKVTLNDTENTVWADTKDAEEKTFAWTIAPKTVTATVVIAGENSFTGEALEPEVTVKDGDTVIPATEYTVEYKDNVNAGTATVTVKDAANGNYAVTGTETFEIAKAAMEGATINANYKYAVEGDQTLEIAGIPANAGTVTYTVGTVTDAKDVITDPTVADGKISFKLNGMDAFAEGTTATFKVTVSMTNYADKVVDVTITITDRDVPTISAQAITKTYNGEAVTAADIKGTASVDGTWSFVDAQEMKEVGTYENVTVKFVPTDSTNYAEATAKITVTINQATPTGKPEFTKITAAGKTLNDVEVNLDKMVPAGGTFAWVDALDTKIQPNKAYKWTYTPADTKNYKVLEGESVLYAYNPSPDLPVQNTVKVDKTAGGTVTVLGGSLTYGSSVNFTVKPDAGYAVDKIVITDAKGNVIPYTKNANGTYSFTMPNSTITITPVFKWLNPFGDVSEKQWYFSAVKYAYENGLMSGMTKTQFGVGTATTRGMLVAIMDRREGSPVISGRSYFDDVDGKKYYASAIEWAYANKIVSGMGNDKFAPDASITREQLATILFNYAKFKGYDVSVGENTNILSYEDALTLNSWAIPAMQWACGSGLISGVPANGTMYLQPQNNAVREQVASVLMRFIEANK